jgi:type IV conjugative transfer system protein TraL
MRRLPRTIDKPTELLGFRMDEIGVFVSVLLVFLLVDWFFVGLIFSGLVLGFLRGTRQGRPEGHLFHVVYRMGIPLGKLLPPGLKRLSCWQRKIACGLAESQHDKLVLSWLSVVLTVLVIVLSAFLIGMAVRPKPVVVVPGAAVAGVYNAGEMPETVMVQFARNFVVDLANYTPASAEKGYLSAARFMSPELLSRFEPVAREQLKQVVTNRVSQFFTVDAYEVEGKDPLVVRFLGERITYVGRTETERKPYQYRLTLRYGKRTRQNPYGLVVSSVEQNETPTKSILNPKSKNWRVMPAWTESSADSTEQLFNFSSAFVWTG